MVSIICYYNDENQYAEKVCSLKVQDSSYELIGIDNRESKYTLAIAALNIGISQ